LEELMARLSRLVILFAMLGLCVACSRSPVAAPPAISLSPTAIATATSIFPFPVYTDQTSERAFVPSGWMGDLAGISLDESWTQNPYEGKTCIHIAYKPQSGEPGWAGVYWLPPQLDPKQDWGSQVTGVNLRGALRLTFGARGAQGGERVTLFVGGIQGPKGDSLHDKRSLDLTLTPEWREYSINLNGADVSQVVGAFGWVAAEHVEFWLDAVRFE
jgi:hypothetical protein